MLTMAGKPLETKNSVEMGEVGSTFLLLKDCSLEEQSKMSLRILEGGRLEEWHKGGNRCFCKWQQAKFENETTLSRCSTLLNCSPTSPLRQWALTQQFFCITSMTPIFLQLVQSHLTMKWRKYLSPGASTLYFKLRSKNSSLQATSNGTARLCLNLYSHQFHFQMSQMGSWS